MGCQTCGSGKLDTFDWLGDLPIDPSYEPILEIKFKNTRKDFFTDPLRLNLFKGDLVAVEALSGHDIGTVSLTGRLAQMQHKRKNLSKQDIPLKKVYRKASARDIELWEEAKSLEKSTMLSARQIAREMGLDMKISDVEFQADKKKVTFYYIADGRIDFRELIKEYASQFKTRIEMVQIGVRQEAALIGSLGSCGRELCCSTWRTHLPSVGQHTIQTQNLSSNLEKFMGQCGKLKCCLTYEVDNYLDARSEFPKELLELDVKEGIIYPFKTDVLKKTVWYSTHKDRPENLMELNLQTIKEMIAKNKRGIAPKIEELRNDQPLTKKPAQSY